MATTDFLDSCSYLPPDTGYFGLWYKYIATGCTDTLTGSIGDNTLVLGYRKPGGKLECFIDIYTETILGGVYLDGATSTPGDTIYIFIGSTNIADSLNVSLTLKCYQDSILPAAQLVHPKCGDNGSIQLAGIANCSQYQYWWSTSDSGFATINQQSWEVQLDSLSAGTYSLTIEGAFGTSENYNYTLLDSSLAANAGNDTLLCEGQSMVRRKGNAS